MSFSFSFGGDDIEQDDDARSNSSQQGVPAPPQPSSSSAADTTAASNSAFPVAGKPQLPPLTHPWRDMLEKLPSKIAFGLLDVTLDDGTTLALPRRELWDVRVQLMAEDDETDEGPEGLGSHDVKTGVYEGGFKSWESSVDLVKVLANEGRLSLDDRERELRVIELGCGTALPSLAVFYTAAAAVSEEGAPPAKPLSLVLADYNPTVLQLVTLPNLILSWALAQKETNKALEGAFEMEDELELTPEVLAGFENFLASTDISLHFLSGGWSAQLVDMLYGTVASVPAAASDKPRDHDTLILGAETIYSPFALEAFNEMLFSILQKEQQERGHCRCEGLVGAKRLYFGVGGSLDDFIDKARAKGATVTQVREEADGVARGVVRCALT